MLDDIRWNCYLKKWFFRWYGYRRKWAFDEMAVGNNGLFDEMTVGKMVLEEMSQIQSFRPGHFFIKPKYAEEVCSDLHSLKLLFPTVKVKMYLQK